MEELNDQPFPEDPNPGSIFTEEELAPRPILHNDLAIYFLSFLFGIPIGAVFMVINFKNGGNKKGITGVIIFAILFYFIQQQFRSISGQSFIAYFFTNAVGVAVLKYYFWDKYIGKDRVYISKPVWETVLIGIGIIGLLYLLVGVLLASAITFAGH